MLLSLASFAVPLSHDKHEGPLLTPASKALPEFAGSNRAAEAQVFVTSSALSAGLVSLDGASWVQEAQALPSAVNSFGASEVRALLEPYRNLIRNQEEPEDEPSLAGYDLCSMCQAMFRDGECSSARNATTNTIKALRAKLDNRAVRLSAAVGAAPPQLSAALAYTHVELGKLECEDDSAIWWDSCSKLSCMNNMEGVDVSCKYRVAQMSANPMGGSEMGAVMHAQKAASRKGSMNTTNPRLPAAIFQNYFHSHCGAGFDIRTVGMACHFPAKQWCVKLGAISHVNQCKGMFCGKKPCVWTCKKKAAEAGSGDEDDPEDELVSEEDRSTRHVVYETASTLLDTVLPRECHQEVDVTLPPGPDGWPKPTRISTCANPLTGLEEIV